MPVIVSTPSLLKCINSCTTYRRKRSLVTRKTSQARQRATKYNGATVARRESFSFLPLPLTYGPTSVVSVWEGDYSISPDHLYNIRDAVTSVEKRRTKPYFGGITLSKQTCPILDLYFISLRTKTIL